MVAPMEDRDFVRRELDRFDAELPIERAWTPPSSWYASRALYELERRAVFAASWQPVARSADLSRPGDYVAGCIAGEPHVIVRGNDGGLRALHNTCRHKGREVAIGRGNAPNLVCGYHAWSYDLDGRLRSAPRVAGIEDFDREAMSLPPLRAETWGPWVFVSADLDAPSLASSLPELDGRLGATGWERLRLAGHRSWNIACNWKVYVDNYLDGGYHIPHMHPTLDAQIDMATYRTEIFASSSIQSCSPAPSRDERIAYDAAQRIGGGAIYAWLFPNFMINRYGPCLDSNHVVPLGPDRCEVRYEFYFEGDADPSFVEASMAQADVTQREDIAICESVQRGLASSSYDRGRYAPRVETGEHHFHRLLAARLRAAASNRNTP